MNKDEADKVFLEAVKTELEQSCDKLDVNSLARLEVIRHVALDAATSASESAQKNAFNFPLKGLAAAFALVLMVSIFYQNKPSLELELVESLEDIEILVSEESLEFYENIEFYQWLGMNENY